MRSIDTLGPAKPYEEIERLRAERDSLRAKLEKAVGAYKRVIYRAEECGALRDPSATDFGASLASLRAILSELSADAPAQQLDWLRYVPDLVKNAMLTTWNEICADTDCHPLDIEHGKGKHLTFTPAHWAQFSGNVVAAQIKRMIDAPAQDVGTVMLSGGEGGSCVGQPSGIRASAAAERGELQVEKLGRRTITTPAFIEAWREACRAQKAPGYQGGSMSTHSFHPHGPIKTTWWEGETGACASLEFDDCRIDLFARGEDMRERMERAIKAFSYEMHRPDPCKPKQAAAE